MRVTANDYMTTSILDAAHDSQVYLKDLFLSLLHRIVILEKPDTTQGINTMPYPALINVIEQNIDALTAGGYTSGLQPTVNWQGELGDIRRLSYQDVNRWFETAELLELLIYSIAYRLLITGTFSTGENKTRQLIRTVN